MSYYWVLCRESSLSCSQVSFLTFTVLSYLLVTSLGFYSKCYKISDIIEINGDLTFKSVDKMLEGDGFTSKQTQKEKIVNRKQTKKDLIIKDLFKAKKKSYK